ncbi:MAG TPA: class I SAM-dependent methyltransferase [Anaerolineales bacterium]|nr:class I SAM-dependent methyltransferase [Anaerolineales bacterium]
MKDGGASRPRSERMADSSYRLMVAIMAMEDALFSHLEKRVARFGIQPGMTVVDYGCGPGRYTTYYSRLAGRQGKVFAVDIHPLAIDLVRQQMEKYGLDNVEPRLADGYASGLPDGVADLVTAIDMFFAIQDQKAFLAELRRIAKPTGLLILDDGHQPRQRTKEQLAAAGSWQIVEETKDHLKCKPA